MTFFEEAIIGEFISKVSDIVVDISKFKIKEAVKNRKNEHQSPESQIYNIMVYVLNKISYDEYENDQDKIYDAAEKILKSFKSGIDNSENNIKLGLSEICENVDENKCIDFMKLIYRELSKENYSELYREIRLLQYEKESNKTLRIEQKVDEIQYGVQETNKRLNMIETNKYKTAITKNKVVKKENRTQEYVDKWNANMFLNDFDEWDEKAGVNLKLSDVYLDAHLPHFIYGNNEQESTDLKKFLTRYIEMRNQNEMLLILGQPGIGKSTLITWITAHFTEKVDDILVYRFASDLKNIEWKKNSITESILEKLGYLYNDLNGKVLILDGLDEWSIQIDKKDILDNLYEDLIYKANIKDFTLIVTCRMNYISNLYNIKYKYIILCSWDDKQIKSFCSVFQSKTKVCVSKDTIENLIKNKNILGIPLVLYMVLALNITFKNGGSIVDIYDKIFSLEGGIYDRCIDYKRFADSHRISEMKKQIHQISRDIAIWMFENNPDEAYIPAEEYKKICANIAHDNGQNEKDIEQDFIIGNFYKLKHCEGGEGEELYFVHRSIYEYFVVETIYSSIENTIKELSSENQEEFASNIAVYLKQGEITNTIGEYFQYKIMKIFSQLSLEKKNIFYDWWEIAIDKMLKKGMFYYTNKNINYYENIISKECQCFENILKLLRLSFGLSRRKYMLENADRGALEKYIRYCLIENARYKRTSNDIVQQERKNMISNSETSNNGELTQKEIEEMLTGMMREKEYDLCLSQMDLRGIDFDKRLNKIDLSKTNLEGASLIGVNLEGANLKGADLSKAYLIGADLRGADLRGANLKGTIIDEFCVKMVKDKYNLELTKVFNYITNETISYEEYCQRKMQQRWESPYNT